MPEQITITIHPSDGDADLLSVKDAMEQILDLFALASPEDSETDGFGWRLVSASTNTPLTVMGEAYGATGESVDNLALGVKASFARALNEIKAGQTPEVWVTGEKNKAAKRIAQRNTNGIGKTEIFLNHDKPETITPAVAQNMSWLLSKPLKIDAPSRERKEIGSIEGTILRVDTHYNKPALYVVDRLSKREIWCVVPQELQNRIAESTSFNDVWENRRVKIRGVIHYDKDGNLNRVEAKEVVLKPFKKVPLSAITDEGFTGGLSPEEYLNRFRGGDLG